jgi:hypothetical protein
MALSPREDGTWKDPVLSGHFKTEACPGPCCRSGEDGAAGERLNAAASGEANGVVGGISRTIVRTAEPAFLVVLNPPSR